MLVLVAGVVLATGIRFGWEISPRQASVISLAIELLPAITVAVLLGVTAYLFLL